MGLVNLGPREDSCLKENSIVAQKCERSKKKQITNAVNLQTRLPAYEAGITEIMHI